jgi:tetratricopeptide (TPR) repeat protein
MAADDTPARSGDPHDPQGLRQRLFEAVHSGDRALLWEICTQHREAVVAQFPDWRRVPVEARGEADALERYASGLLGVAACFAERLGEPSLLEALTGAGDPATNPLVGWEKAIVSATELASELEYLDAIELLVDTLIDTRDLRGSGVDHYLPRTYGLLGDCYFQSGRGEEALRPTLHALRASDELGDDSATQAYVERLYEIHRYLGQGERAAHFAERGAALLEPESRGARWLLAQARWQRSGEPLCRVALEIEGDRVELEEVSPGQAGPYRFVYVRNRPPLQPSRVWTQRGEAAGRSGNLEEAFSAFASASEADPFDPHPHYQAGTLALFSQRYFLATEELWLAEELAPGWFDVRTRLRLSQELALERISPKVLAAARELERAELEPQEALSKVEDARVDSPSHPLLLLHRGRCLTRMGRAEEARQAYSTALEEAEDDPSLRTRLHLELALASPAEERKRHLECACQLGEHFVAAATAGILLRQ